MAPVAPLPSGASESSTGAVTPRAGPRAAREEGRLLRRPRADPADHHRLRVGDERVGTVRQRRAQWRTLLFGSQAGAHRPTFRVRRGRLRGDPQRGDLAVPSATRSRPPLPGSSAWSPAIVAPIAILRRIVLSPTITVRLVRRALDLSPAAPCLRLPVPPDRDPQRQPVLRPDDDAQRIRLHLFQLYDAGHDRVRRLHGGEQPRADGLGVPGPCRAALPRLGRRAARR